MIKIRSGIGYDIHRLVSGDGLMIGGVKVSSHIRAEAHSDGDVLVHSLIDALLGAMAQPDIGELFPDGDPTFKGIAGADLLEKVKSLLEEKNFEIMNIDSVVVLEEPKLSPFKSAIRKRIAAILDIAQADFNLKGKSKEKLDAVGRGEAVECFSIAMIRFKGDSVSDSDRKK
ncbi:MAG: 2-C-methyl-D-erythritol 2,4-cyclodiphosphate synthase [Candidatus Aminicenantes bacterium]|nr:2-C-methyl-D-erythritol 2,4-cyclodiphosphate synthase [Candidatus Aminicenantes bacterium]